MKRISLTAAWLCVCLYAVISAILGPRGLLATQDALRQAEAMRSRVGELRTRYELLDAEWRSLRQDPERIAVEGRALGYLAGDEVALRVRPGRPAAAEPRGPGEMVAFEAPEALGDGEAKAYALAGGLIAAAAYALVAALRRAKAGAGRERSEPPRELEREGETPARAEPVALFG